MVSWFSTHLYPACLPACLPVCLSVSLSVYVCHQFFSKWFLVFGVFFTFLQEVTKVDIMAIVRRSQIFLGKF